MFRTASLERYIDMEWKWCSQGATLENSPECICIVNIFLMKWLGSCCWLILCSLSAMLWQAFAH